MWCTNAFTLSVNRRTARIVLGAAEAHTEQQEQTYLNICMEAYLKAYRLQRVDQPLNVVSVSSLTSKNC